MNPKPKKLFCKPQWKITPKPRKSHDEHHSHVSKLEERAVGHSGAWIVFGFDFKDWVTTAEGPIFCFGFDPNSHI